ncbi:low-specificity L-threonine aldolase [Cupriavidus numazuensis]|uniref:Low specificity L-threonine aldolase n=1 Tax=Cupriavidus numazuensis TaxID=221992 RepID=A0ABM8TRM2_9BURK|nr:low-specificity L-threonine aldolase [Cupriavidus numazuensis]CAG2158880.1 Low specificity L-threonine aldolase [Cupriavidus numazuensis]
MNKLIDLRSDTVTRPTPAMYEQMLRAPLGDDTYGEDPTVNALQERVASILGFEAALFVPTGTQSNLCAILAHCGRGDEYIVGQNAHCYRWEGGGAAVLGGVQPQPVEHEADGTLLLARLREAVKPDNEHHAITRLLTLENTIGGKMLPLPYLDAATLLATECGLATHLDGARLFNAAVAQAERSGTTPTLEARRIASHFDTVSVCFSKGLGAPAGSALCGNANFIKRAKRIRKLCGGAMRQSGILASAALYALDHNIARLAEDHRLAMLLYEGLLDIDGVQVERPDTNILFLELQGTAQERSSELLRTLGSAGIAATGHYQRLRLVTHMDVDEVDIAHAIQTIRNFFKKS